MSTPRPEPTELTKKLVDIRGQSNMKYRQQQFGRLLNQLDQAARSSKDRFGQFGPMREIWTAYAASTPVLLADATLVLRHATDPIYPDYPLRDGFTHELIKFVETGGNGAGLVPDRGFYSTAMLGYARLDLIDRVREVYESATKLNIQFESADFTRCIQACALNGSLEMAAQFFLYMKAGGYPVTEDAYYHLLNTFCTADNEPLFGPERTPEQRAKQAEQKILGALDVIERARQDGVTPTPPRFYEATLLLLASSIATQPAGQPRSAHAMRLINTWLEEVDSQNRAIFQNAGHAAEADEDLWALYRQRNEERRQLMKQPGAEAPPPSEGPSPLASVQLVRLPGPDSFLLAMRACADDKDPTQELLVAMLQRGIDVSDGVVAHLTRLYLQDDRDSLPSLVDVVESFPHVQFSRQTLENLIVALLQTKSSKELLKRACEFAKRGPGLSDLLVELVLSRIDTGRSPCSFEEFQRKSNGLSAAVDRAQSRPIRATGAPNTSAFLERLDLHTKILEEPVARTYPRSTEFRKEIGKAPTWEKLANQLSAFLRDMTKRSTVPLGILEADAVWDRLDRISAERAQQQPVAWQQVKSFLATDEYNLRQCQHFTMRFFTRALRAYIQTSGRRDVVLDVLKELQRFDLPVEHEVFDLVARYLAKGPVRDLAELFRRQPSELRTHHFDLFQEAMAVAVRDLTAKETPEVAIKPHSKDSAVHHLQYVFEHCLHMLSFAKQDATIFTDFAHRCALTFVMHRKVYYALAILHQLLINSLPPRLDLLSKIVLTLEGERPLTDLDASRVNPQFITAAAFNAEQFMYTLQSNQIEYRHKTVCYLARFCLITNNKMQAVQLLRSQAEAFGTPAAALHLLQTFSPSRTDGFGRRGNNWGFLPLGPILNCLAAVVREGPWNFFDANPLLLDAVQPYLPLVHVSEAGALLVLPELIEVVRKRFPKSATQIDSVINKFCTEELFVRDGDDFAVLRLKIAQADHALLQGLVRVLTRDQFLAVIARVLRTMHFETVVHTMRFLSRVAAREPQAFPPDLLTDCLIHAFNSAIKVATPMVLATNRNPARPDPVYIPLNVQLRPMTPDPRLQTLGFLRYFAEFMTSREFPPIPKVLAMLLRHTAPSDIAFARKVQGVLVDMPTSVEPLEALIEFFERAVSSSGSLAATNTSVRGPSAPPVPELALGVYQLCQSLVQSSSKPTDTVLPTLLTRALSLGISMGDELRIFGLLRSCPPRVLSSSIFSSALALKRPPAALLPLLGEVCVTALPYLSGRALARVFIRAQDAILAHPSARGHPPTLSNPSEEASTDSYRVALSWEEVVRQPHNVLRMRADMLREVDQGLNNLSSAAFEALLHAAAAGRLDHQSFASDRVVDCRFVDEVAPARGRLPQPSGLFVWLALRHLSVLRRRSTQTDLTASLDHIQMLLMNVLGQLHAAYPEELMAVYESARTESVASAPRVFSDADASSSPAIGMFGSGASRLEIPQPGALDRLLPSGPAWTPARLALAQLRTVLGSFMRASTPLQPIYSLFKRRPLAPIGLFPSHAKLVGNDGLGVTFPERSAELAIFIEARAPAATLSLRAQKMRSLVLALDRFRVPLSMQLHAALMDFFTASDDAEMLRALWLERPRFIGPVDPIFGVTSRAAAANACLTCGDLEGALNHLNAIVKDGYEIHSSLKDALLNQLQFSPTQLEPLIKAAESLPVTQLREASAPKASPAADPAPQTTPAPNSQQGQASSSNV